MNFEQIKKYWDERASSDSSAQSTTQDFYLREIEFNVLKNAIKSFRPLTVLDVGCGDGRTTARLAAQFQDIFFVGCDYSDAMLNNARKNIQTANIRNFSVTISDVTASLPGATFDFVYTTRCLINLPSWELQKQSIRNIASKLKKDGLYVMIENFIDGHENFNGVRRILKLPEIPVREHNLYFEKSKLLAVADPFFELIEESNISSTYYLVSRGIYSKLCQDKGIAPDYFDDHHKYAAQLPFAGEYGPVRMLLFKRR